MRWWWLLAVAACGSDRVTVPATVVHADVTMMMCGSQCYPALELDGICMPDADRIDDNTHEISAVSGIDADKIAGIVEVIYSGSVAGDGPPPYLATILGAGETAEVYAAGDAAQLYRIDPKLGVVDLDRTRLSAASGDMLRFEYADTVEQHTVVKARPISVNVYGDDEPCCSAARPSTGLLWLIALMQISATRRCRRARPLRR